MLVSGDGAPRLAEPQQASCPPARTPHANRNPLASATQSPSVPTCAGGALWCWGRNANGELGLGNSGVPVSTPTQVGVDKDWARPELGQGLTTCALKKTGDLFCWGVGSYGQLGLGSLSSFNTPQKVPSIGGWTSVSIGNEHVCGVRADGRLFSAARGAVSLEASSARGAVPVEALALLALLTLLAPPCLAVAWRGRGR